MNRPSTIAVGAVLAVAAVLFVSASAGGNWTIGSPSSTSQIDQHANFTASGMTEGDTPQGATCTCELYRYGNGSNPPSSWFAALLESRTGTANGQVAWTTAPGDEFDPTTLTGGVWPEVAGQQEDMIMKLKVGTMEHDLAWYDVTQDP